MGPLYSVLNFSALKRKIKKANLELFGWIALLALLIFSMVICFPSVRNGLSNLYTTASLWGVELIEEPIHILHRYQDTKSLEDRVRRDANLLKKLKNHEETLIDRIASLEKENTDLRHILKVSEATPLGYLTVPAVGANMLHTERSILFLKAGTQQGLKEKLPVYFNDQVIGLTQYVAPTSARVILLNDPSSRVPVCFEKSQDQGILTGDGRGGLMIQLRNTNHAIPKGAKVFTAGAGGIFPRYKFIGTVKSQESETLNVKWAVSPESLSYVQVQLNPEISNEVRGEED